MKLTPSQWLNYFLYLRNAFLVSLILIVLGNHQIELIGINLINPLLNMVGTGLAYLDALMWLLVAILVLNTVYHYYYLHTFFYEIDNGRITNEYGILSRKLEEIELYRVKDYSVSQNFIMRLIGLSNVKIETSDINQPVFVFRGVYNGKEFMDDLRKEVEILREEKGVREFD